MVEIFVWVLLYFPPQQLPQYVSVWHSQTLCEQKANALNKFKGTEQFGCVREALRDTTND